MLKKFTVIAFTSVVVASGVPVQPAPPVPQETQNTSAIHLSKGQLFLNGKLIHKGFSVMQTRFTYLYFYVPEHGLFTVSNREFDGAMQNGMFAGQDLSFSVNGLELMLKSSSQILAEGSSVAWIKFDPNFKLDVKSVMLGYGDKEKAPYEWPDQIRKKRD
jgi:hypothetical protein